MCYRWVTHAGRVRWCVCVRSRSQKTESFTDVLQFGEPACGAGELVSEARAGCADEVQQHKQILDEEFFVGERKGKVKRSGEIHIPKISP